LADFFFASENVFCIFVQQTLQWKVWLSCSETANFIFCISTAIKTVFDSAENGFHGSAWQIRLLQAKMSFAFADVLLIDVKTRWTLSKEPISVAFCLK
jgi:hypothetical protein